MSERLAGKIAVITGASSGIGLASAQRFVKEGAFVYITGRRQDRLDAAVATLGGQGRGIVGDAADLTHLDRLYATIGKEKGRLDVVFSAAAFAQPQAISQMTQASFDATFGLNVRGAAFTVQKALPLLADGSSVILMGSIAGSKGNPGRGAYNASKATLRSFARSWTMDLRDRNIRVNVLSPGPTETASFGNNTEAKQRMAALTPMGRLGQPWEIANAALFLASEESSFVTGTEMFVDGGFAQV
ncbi:SDR family oxidoreductase [Mesorhizobium sp. VK23B]|uniref:SDR family oxidoreductase n=1 Tax=Mesorhizobium dulcispinae TaxID=3072316 RepID=A0ABU4XS54_9HYPH|nr:MULTISPECIES: SDR family oxidoreductase [unclassified Mesorhizobium]MDX8470270.1 SDR family oxidoreductase [Mesorhizobium sp. VK23B]MDX8476675.1 SDR family oxidoreductase [Mesorhizobium sp. VK23A]